MTNCLSLDFSPSSTPPLSCFRLPEISSSLAEGEPSLTALVNGGKLPRYRGVSVDRHREYTAPQYYEDTYYKRDPYDSSGDDRARYDSLPGRARGGGGTYQSDIYDGLEEEEETEAGGERTIFKLERQWSHPNLRPRPRGAGRRLPKTPRQPSGIMIPPSSPSMNHDDLLEWVENERIRRTPNLTNQCSYESDNYSPPRNCSRDPHGGYSPPPPIRTDSKRRTPVSERRVGTGRMLPKPPPGGSHLVLNAAQAKPNRGISRERKLPKPSSLEIRLPGRDLPSRSTSINFPRIDSSPSRMSNFINGTSIIPSLPPNKAGGYTRHRPHLD